MVRRTAHVQSGTIVENECCLCKFFVKRESGCNAGYLPICRISGAMLRVKWGYSGRACAQGSIGMGEIFVMEERTWILRCRMCYANCPEAEKRAAEVLIGQADRVGGYTLRACAKAAGCGQQTVVRFLNRCGYGSWKEFQREVWNSESRQATEVSYTGNSRKRVEEIPRKVAAQTMEILTDFTQHMDLQVFSAVVRLLKKAKSIEIYGAECSAGIAADLTGKLLYLGLPCRTYNDLFFQKISAGHVGNKDVVIGISQSGQTKMILDAVEAAKENGAVTVGITGTDTSALAKLVDYTFVTPSGEDSPEGRWVVSRAMQMVLNDMLCQALLASDEERFRDSLVRSGREIIGDVVAET